MLDHAFAGHTEKKSKLHLGQYKFYEQWRMTWKIRVTVSVLPPIIYCHHLIFRLCGATVSPGGQLVVNVRQLFFQKVLGSISVDIYEGTFIIQLRLLCKFLPWEVVLLKIHSSTLDTWN